MEAFDLEAERHRRAQLAYDYAVAQERAERRAWVRDNLVLFAGWATLAAIVVIAVWMDGR